MNALVVIMTRTIALILCASPACADTADLGGTTVTLRPSHQPGAVAEIIFDNRSVNGRFHEGEYTLTLDGLTVSFTFDWDTGTSTHDAITVTPPAGVICGPSCTLTLAEGDTGTLWLFSGMEGM